MNSQWIWARCTKCGDVWMSYSLLRSCLVRLCVCGGILVRCDPPEFKIEAGSEEMSSLEWYGWVRKSEMRPWERICGPLTLDDCTLALSRYGREYKIRPQHRCMTTGGAPIIGNGMPEPPEPDLFAENAVPGV